VNTLKALFVSSRPLSWINTAFPFAAAYVLTSLLAPTTTAYSGSYGPLSQADPLPDGTRAVIFSAPEDVLSPVNWLVLIVGALYFLIP